MPSSFGRRTKEFHAKTRRREEERDNSLCAAGAIESKWRFAPKNVSLLFAPLRLCVKLFPFSCAQHRQVELVLARASDGFLVAGVGVTHHAGGTIVPQHAFDAACGLV